MNPDQPVARASRPPRRSHWIVLAVAGALALVFVLVATIWPDTDADTTETSGPLGCVDASASVHEPSPDSRALITDTSGTGWLIDKDGEREQVDLSGIESYWNVVLGGDGRLWWTPRDGGRLAATDLRTGDTESIAIEGLDTFASVAPSTDGVVTTVDNKVLRLSGSPLSLHAQDVPDLDGSMAVFSVGRDDVIWTSTSNDDGEGRVNAIALDGTITTFEGDIATASAYTFPGTGCAIRVTADCPQRVVRLAIADPTSVASTKVGDSSCFGSPDVSEGVVWVPNGHRLHRLDLRTGAIAKSASIDGCLEGARVFSGPGHVALADDCDGAMYDFDVTTAALLTDEQFLDDDSDAAFEYEGNSGDWPWLGAGPRLYYLPTFERVSPDLPPPVEGRLSELVAVIPPELDVRTA